MRLYDLVTTTVSFLALSETLAAPSSLRQRASGTSYVQLLQSPPVGPTIPSYSMTEYPYIITNINYNGAAPIASITSVNTNPNGAPPELLSNGCPSTLAKGESCYVSYGVRPNANDITNGRITVTTTVSSEGQTMDGPAIVTTTAEIITSEMPTAYPTSAPSAMPSSEPTKMVTKAPTIDPTVAPTVAPSEAPSFAPVAMPTSMPSAKSTEMETEAPTVDPTVAPTVAPSEAPSFTPVTMPTSMPSAKSTEMETEAPTAAPSSILASSQPTSQPSVALDPNSLDDDMHHPYTAPYCSTHWEVCYLIPVTTATAALAALGYYFHRKSSAAAALNSDTAMRLLPKEGGTNRDSDVGETNIRLSYSLFSHRDSVTQGVNPRQNLNQNTI